MAVAEPFARPTGRDSSIAGAGRVGKFLVGVRAGMRREPGTTTFVTPDLIRGLALIQCAPIVHADHHLGDMLLRVPVRRCGALVLFEKGSLVV